MNKKNNLRIEEIKEFVENKFTIIDNIEDMSFKHLCLFSLIECFAQEYSNYNKNNTENFTNFINIFANNPLLEKHDPVTLYYMYNKKINNSEFNLDYLYDSITNYPELDWSGISVLPNTNKIIKICEDNNLDIKRHKYINLIYKWRSKFSHEMSAPSTIFNSMQEYNAPTYYELSQLLKESNNSSVHLIFPYLFLRNLFKQAINQYIIYCETEEIDPFKNSKNYLSWYE